MDLSEGEVLTATDIMDLDQDGAVSLDDFMGFMGRQGEDIVSVDSVASRLSSAIVDIKVSASKAEEVALEQQGYKSLTANLNEGTFGKPIYLWFRRLKHGGAGTRLKPLVDIVVHPKSVDSALVVDGYQCIPVSLNTGNTLAASNFLWIRRATTEEEECRDAIIDVAITTGKAKDRTSEIHNPPSAGFCRVHGNLNERTMGTDIFLWYRPIKGRQMSAMPGGSSFRVASTLTEDRRRTEMGKNIRRHIRQYVAPSQVSAQMVGPIDFAAIFNKYDVRHKGKLTKAQMQKLLREVGLNVEAKDLSLLVGRIDSSTPTTEVSREEFLHFIALSEDEVDEVCDALRRRFGIGGYGKVFGRPHKEQIKALRRRFEQLDGDGDGVLSRQDICKMLENASIYVTAEELETIIRSRFDLDGDGRVDLLNFLKFFLSKDNKDRRMAARVSHALEALHNWALSMQKEKLKGANTNNVDSVTAWNELVRRHTIATKKAFPGHLGVDDVGMALERLNVRLSLKEVYRTVQRIAPLSEGQISADTFHSFICTEPRTTGQLLKVLEKEILPQLVESYRRLRHQQHRKNYHAVEEEFGGGNMAATSSPKVFFGPGSSRTPGSTARKLFASPSHGQPLSPMGRTSFKGTARAGSTRALSGVGTTARQAPAPSPFHQARTAALRLGSGGRTTSAFLLQPQIIEEDEVGEEEAAFRDAFGQLLEEAEQSIKADDAGMATIDSVRNGLATLSSTDKALLTASEWAQTVQFVGADDPERYLVDCKRLFEGVCMAILSEEDTSAEEVAEEVALANMEALDLVCEDLVRMIQEEALQPDGSLDYSKPFRLFDEDGSGTVPIDEFRRMLYRLNVDSLLRENQVVELMNRFDVDRAGSITLQEFQAFAEKKSWGESGVEDDVQLSPPPLHASSKLMNRTNALAKQTSKGKAAWPEDVDKYKITGTQQGDSLVMAIAEKLHKSHRWKGGKTDAEMDVLAGFMAMDQQRVGHLPPAKVMASLKRLEITLDMPPAAAEQALGVEAFKAKTHGEVDYKLLVAAIMRGWAALTASKGPKSKGGFMTGSDTLDRKLASLQKEFRAIATPRASDALQGTTFYSHRMHKIFDKMDADGNGRLSAAEFRRGLRQQGLGAYLNDRDMRRIFNAFDQDSNGSVDYAEFCDFILHTVLNKSATSEDSDSDSATSLGTSSSGFDSDDLFGDEHGGHLSTLYTKAAKLMWVFAPTEAKQKRVWDYMRSKEHGSAGAGQVTEKRFRDFLRRSGAGPSPKGDALTSKEVSELVGVLDPKCKGSVNYAKFLKKVFEELKPKAPKPADDGASKKPSQAPDLPSILHQLQEAILQSNARGRPYHGLFALSDEHRSGLVQLDALKHTLGMLGCRLQDADVLKIIKALPERSDGMVDFEELYRLLLRTPPPMHLMPRPHLTHFGGGTVLMWPPPVTVSGGAGHGDMGVDLFSGSTSHCGDVVMMDVASRVRQRVLEKTQQWGPQFSLSRQFEFHDPHGKGLVATEDFANVLEQLSVDLSRHELQRLEQLFDRYGDHAMDYMEFCNRVLCESADTQAVARKLCARFSDLRRNGVDIRAAFEMFDLSRTGFVSRTSFREVIKRLQVPVTEHQVQALQSSFCQLGQPDSISYEDLLAFACTPALSPPVKQPRPAWGYSPLSASGAAPRRSITDHRAGQRGSTCSVAYGTHCKAVAPAASIKAECSCDCRCSKCASVSKPNPKAISSKHSWMCAICFYTDNVGTASMCDICNAPRAGVRQMHVMQVCANCTFENVETSAECQMCGEPLPFGKSHR
eukprot:TRINITY_DN2382_c0_g1_i1.p1 TRINITY_DN2382_c0_g1~~TRINITY_DN2382_c0_g1_i1.p1  ORF type:complete len:1787 (+),score=415.93 TRINITY_DN2382_c0_g1_i1:3-5363(+)